MLKISKLADYATVIMHYLAEHPENLQSANQIAQHVQLSLPTVSKILKKLFEAGLVTSMRGAGGGYKLAQAAKNITIAQVIAAIEGAPALTECSQTAHRCMQDSVCAVKHNWQMINNFILKTLNNLTLSDMAKPFTLPLEGSTIRREIGQ